MCAMRTCDAASDDSYSLEGETPLNELVGCVPRVDIHLAGA
jgi:hypothetical protein